MAATRLRLAGSVLKKVQMHGHATYPNECCGALLGRDSLVSAVHALPNTTEEGPRRRFLVRPGDYMEAERQAALRGLDLLGFYHSHPDHPARPSQYDLDHAWPSFSYVIVSVKNGDPAEITSWRLREDRAAFDEESLEVVEGAEVQASEVSRAAGER